ncbi:MAG: isoprenylcysteine carboxylmethyltransferase family protein, partial [Thiotrichaceae bacterium]
NNASHLVTSGMYRYTRNPMYVGLAILLTGWAIYLGSASPFLLIPLFVFVLTIQQIKPEEVILEEKFGQEYINYKNSVRRWL